MTTISVPISEEWLARLQELAVRTGVPAEELARAGLEDWLRQPREDFTAWVRDHVIEKKSTDQERQTTES